MNDQSSPPHIQRLLDHSAWLHQKSDQLQAEAVRLNDYIEELMVEQEALKEHIAMLTRGIEEQRNQIALLLDPDTE